MPTLLRIVGPLTPGAFVSWVMGNATNLNEDMMRNFILIILLQTICSTVFSQSVQKRTEPEPKYQNYVFGKETSFENQRYFVIQDLFAIRENKISSQFQKSGNSPSLSDKTTTQNKVENGPIQNKGGFSIYEKGSSGSLSTSTSSSRGNYPVVYNPRTDNLGIVLGNSIVKVTDLSEIGVISKKYNLQILRTFPHLKTAILKSNDPAEIISINERIGLENGVTSSEVEVLENAYIPL